jgi:uncharacterized protein YchJ
MTKKFFAGLFILMILTACAGPGMKKANMSDDLGSPEKVALLKERAHDFWTAFVEEDYKRVYDIYDPFFRARVDFQGFMGLTGKLKYHSFKIKDATVEGNIGKVKVELAFSLTKTLYEHAEFSSPESTTEFEATWLYIYDNWYKEWYLSSLDDSYTRY